MKNLTVLCIAFFLLKSVTEVSAQGTCPANDAAGLKYCLDASAIPMGPNIILVTGEINLDELNVSDLPLIVPSGVVVQGNFNLLSNPEGTLIKTSRRFDYYSQTDKIFAFNMLHGSAIKNIRLQGGMHHWLDYNDDLILSGGIMMKRKGCTECNMSVPCPDCIGQGFTISECEISGFTYMGIESDVRTSDINIEKTFIHHIKGNRGPGVGYGIWTKGSKTTVLTPHTNISNIVFDECKAGIDGDGEPMEWSINNCTFTQFFFSEEINLHNDGDFSSTPYPHDCTNSPGCLFYNPIVGGGYNQSDTECSPLVQSFPIDDVGGAYTHINNNIFHFARPLMSPSSNINLPYPNRVPTNFGNVNNYVKIESNTFASPHLSQPITGNFGGYARIADNYIESCPWQGDNSIVYKDISGNPANSFDYQPTFSVSPLTCPQPPQIQMFIQDGSGSSIDFINLEDAISDEVHIVVNPLPGLGATDLSYIIRPNTNNNGTIISDQIMTNNHYYVDQLVSNLSPVNTPYTYNFPGLYGVDALGIANSSGGGSSTYNASSWIYKPIIVVPPGNESKLIFNIKDSYHEKIDPTTGFPSPAQTLPTKVLKQVSLNAHANIIWSEDIAYGGDDWERVEISLSDPVVAGYMVNGVNTLYVGIAIESGADVSSSLVEGVIVWLDDVYINKYGDPQGENLIDNGNMEDCESIGGTTCSWKIGNNTNVCTVPLSASSNEDFITYPDGTTFDLTSAPIYTKVDDSILERKSGKKSALMQLPKISCPTYVTGTGLNMTSIKTNFSFERSCSNYTFEFDPTQYLPNVSYNLNTSITILGNLTLIGNTLALGPGVTITVPVGGILQITNSHLFACGAMWQGIINDGGTVIIDGSTIEDAVTALKTLNNGQVNITHNTFNHNYTSLWFEQGNYDLNNGFNNIYGNTFDNTGGKIIKSPHAQEDPFHHIFLSLVSGITIGNALQDENIFHNSINGIYAKKSNLKSFNNTFNNIGGDGYQNRIIVYPIASANAAINATGDNLFLYSLVAGGSNTNELNRFNECEMGILVYLDMNINVTYNLFNLCKSACQLQSIKSGNIIFKHNSVDRFIYGIALWDVFSNATVLVNQNYFNQGFSYDPNNYATKAISLQNYSMQGAYYDISENTIANCEKGIHLRNISAYIAGPAGTAGLSVNGNLIETMIPNIDLINPHYGIWVENCFGANIINNTVNRVSFGGLPAYTSTALQQDILRGISVDKSDRTLVRDNYTENMGTDIRVLGHCLGTELQCNRMRNSFQGIKLVSAKITTLPQIGSLTSPNDNTWEGDYLQSSNERILGNFDDGVLRNYYHRDFTGLGVDPLNLFCPYYPIIGKPINPVNGATGNWRCNFVQPVIDDRDEMLMVSTNQVQFDEFEAENQFYSKQFAYEALSADSTLMYTGNQNDLWLQQFYTAQKLGNAGRIKDVKDYIAIKNIQLAQMNNLSIVDSTLVLQNLKWVNGYYLENLFDTDFIHLDTIVHSQMENLAQSNGIQGGEGVYYARAILGIDVEDAVNVMREAQSQIKNNLQNSIERFRIFPNPTHDKFYVSYFIMNEGSLSILDGTLRVLKVIELDHSKTSDEIDVSEFADGFYYCLIKSGDLINVSKLTIVK